MARRRRTYILKIKLSLQRSAPAALEEGLLVRPLHENEDYPAVVENPATFAVIARVFWGELPYLRSFIAHYTKIGVERVVLVVTDKNDVEEITQYLKSIGFNHGAMDLKAGRSFLSSPLYSSTQVDVRVLPELHVLMRHVPDPVASIIPHDDTFWSHLRKLDLNLTQDYLIAIDADEYLSPPIQAMSLAHMVVPFPDADIFFFEWVVAPYDADGAGPSFGYLGVEVPMPKYMIKTSSLLTLGDEEQTIGPHGPAKTTCSPNCTTVDMGHRLVHFQYRGLWDAVIKDVAGRFKAQGAEGVLKKLNAYEPTERLKCMAFASVLASMYGKPVDFSHWTPELSVDKDAEKIALRSHAFPNIGSKMEPKDLEERFAMLYADFKAVLSYGDIWSSLADIEHASPGHYAARLRGLTLKDLVASHLAFVQSQGSQTP